MVVTHPYTYLPKSLLQCRKVFNGYLVTRIGQDVQLTAFACLSAAWVH